MTAASVPSSARFEFRLRPEAKQRLEFAADLVRETTSDFARTAVEARIDAVLYQHGIATEVPAEFFDQLLAALDAPPSANAALAAAAARARETVERR
jgi:uncharacterized protein (DUF1778 family)